MAYGNYTEYRISKILRYLRPKFEQCTLIREYEVPNKIHTDTNTWREYAIGKITLEVRIDGIAEYTLSIHNEPLSCLTFSSQDKVIEQLEVWL